MFFNKETLISRYNARKELLNARDPVANANLIKKLDRRIRLLSK